MLQLTFLPNYKMQNAGSLSLQHPKMTAHSRQKHIKTGRQSISAMFASCNTPKRLQEFKNTKKQKHQGDRRFNCAEDNKRCLFANN